MEKKFKVDTSFFENGKFRVYPYLGIVNFENTKERTNILKQYNLYGLPFGNWPDLPPEVVKSEINTKMQKKV